MIQITLAYPPEFLYRNISQKATFPQLYEPTLTLFLIITPSIIIFHRFPLFFVIHDLSFLNLKSYPYITPVQLLEICLSMADRSLI